jgi:hypothetical protein
MTTLSARRRVVVARQIVPRTTIRPITARAAMMTNASVFMA